MRLKWIICIAIFVSSLAAGQIYVQPSNPYVATSSSINLYAVCRDIATGLIVYPCSVSLGNSYYLNQNGHTETTTHTQPRPTSAYGRLSSYGGAYSTSQGYPFTFYASRVGGWEYIQVCPQVGYCTSTDVKVSYQDIYLYGGAPSNVFIGGTASHPAGNNHAGTTAFNNAITAVTNQYQNEFGCYSNYQVVGLNDMSLPFGGIFDVGNPATGLLPGRWVEPHAAHDRGRSADFKYKPGPPMEANSILGDPGVVQRFMAICVEKGLGYAQIHSPGSSNQHVHCGYNSNGF